ncbi:MAG: hypothetical protein WBP13_06855 [Methylophilaceae bacterium]
MKRILIAATLASAAFMTPAFADNVGVSVSIGQPGFYGRIDIGGYPAPTVIYREPRVVQQVYTTSEPIYLRVPPAQRRNWRRYCGRYDACGERVYFVQDNWYNREYVPRYQENHRDHHDGYRDDRKYEHQDDRREDHKDNRQHNHESDHRNGQDNQHGNDHRNDNGNRDDRDQH